MVYLMIIFARSHGATGLMEGGVLLYSLYEKKMKKRVGKTEGCFLVEAMDLLDYVKVDQVWQCFESTKAAMRLNRNKQLIGVNDQS